MKCTLPGFIYPNVVSSRSNGAFMADVVWPVYLQILRMYPLKVLDVEE
jgi:hypothetical protein